jgi:hypothetical protein
LVKKEIGLSRLGTVAANNAAWVKVRSKRNNRPNLTDGGGGMNCCLQDFTATPILPELRRMINLKHTSDMAGKSGLILR